MNWQRGSWELPSYPQFWIRYLTNLWAINTRFPDSLLPCRSKYGEMLIPKWAVKFFDTSLYATCLYIFSAIYNSGAVGLYDISGSGFRRKCIFHYRLRPVGHRENQHGFGLHEDSRTTLPAQFRQIIGVFTLVLQLQFPVRVPVDAHYGRIFGTTHGSQVLKEIAHHFAAVRYSGIN